MEQTPTTKEPRQELKLLLTTLPDLESAQSIAHGLVESRLAACVQILPGVRSIYRWEENVEEADELVLLAKLPAHNYELAQKWIKARHPYQVPEILGLPIDAGLESYVGWVTVATLPSTDAEG
jgi:periplasmic divalent cation tolerance protein